MNDAKCGRLLNRIFQRIDDIRYTNLTGLITNDLRLER